jgi:16S rRNA (guanine966-N2)-methyltransferase
MLRENLELLGAIGAATVHEGDALEFSAPAAAFDIVFLDPPFDADLWQGALAQLLRCEALAPGALLYLEYPARQDAVLSPALAECFERHRDGRAGAVSYGLERYRP